MTKEVPLLLKNPNKEIDELLDMAFTYLQAYKDTRDWGFLPTVEHCVARISIIHMRETPNGSQSNSKR